MSFISDATQYLNLAENVIPSKHFKAGQIDHICYRATSTEEYKNLCEQLKTESRLLTESDVNGRPISCFFFADGILSKNNKVHVIEVASPKPGSAHTPGFEHIEIFSDQPEDKDLHFENVRIKFCDKSLLDIVQDERWEKLKNQLHSSTSIFNTSSKKTEYKGILKNTQVLEKLSDYNPRICGTIPLGIAQPNSDIDIACEVKDLSAFKQYLQTQFQKYSDFKISATNIHIACQFKVQNITVEIYGENIPTEKQRAYVHMMAEAQLISYTGEWAIDEIRSIKTRGIKTEPAFAEFYGISGDPYIALYDLYSSASTLRDLSLKRLTKM
ncbi:MAG: VOC family protein [Bdellovibrionales bacterium]|nr:VOC family protein [Bdellovibrionales bacterium]